jgi:hypothetical protein
MTKSYLIRQNEPLSKRSMAIVNGKVERVGFCRKVLISQINRSDPLIFRRIVGDLTLIFERTDISIYFHCICANSMISRRCEMLIRV